MNKKRKIIFDDDEEVIEVNINKNSVETGSLCTDTVELILEYLQPSDQVTLMVNHQWAGIIINNILKLCKEFVIGTGNSLPGEEDALNCTIQPRPRKKKKHNTSSAVASAASTENTEVVKLKRKPPALRSNEKGFLVKDIKNVKTMLTEFHKLKSFEDVLKTVVAVAPIVLAYNFTIRYRNNFLSSGKLNIPPDLAFKVRSLSSEIARRTIIKGSPKKFRQTPQIGEKMLQLERFYPEKTIEEIKFIELQKLASDYISRKQTKAEVERVKMVIFCAPDGSPTIKSEIDNAYRLKFNWEFNTIHSGRVKLTISLGIPLRRKQADIREIVYTEVGLVQNGSPLIVKKFLYENTVVGTIINAMDDNPKNAIATYGSFAGSCCYCGLVLTDKNAIESGYGSTCAKNYKLPYPSNNRAIADVLIHKLPEYQKQRF